MRWQRTPVPVKKLVGKVKRQEQEPTAQRQSSLLYLGSLAVLVLVEMQSRDMGRGWS